MPSHIRSSYASALASSAYSNPGKGCIISFLAFFQPSTGLDFNIVPAQ